MNSVNVNISVTNLPQIDRHQSDLHRTPVVHQTKNGEIARDQLELQARITSDAKKAEGKNVDPKDRKKEKGRQAKKAQRMSAEQPEAPNRPERADNGSLIDIQA